jgi:hypothetical protein
MRITTLLSTICAATLCYVAAAGAQALPDLGQAASSAAGAVEKNAVDSAKQATSNKLTQIKDSGKGAIAKACADQAQSQGLAGKALRKFVASCTKNGGQPQ